MKNCYHTLSLELICDSFLKKKRIEKKQSLQELKWSAFIGSGHPVVTVSRSWVDLKSSQKQTNTTQISCLTKVSA